MNRRNFASVALSLGLFVFAGAALAQTPSWTGASSANWSDPDNWSPAGVPSSPGTVILPSGATRSNITVDSNVNNSLLVEADYQLSLGANTLKANYVTLGANALNVTASAGSLLDISSLTGTGSLTMSGGVARVWDCRTAVTLDVDTLQMADGGLYISSATANRVTGNGYVNVLKVTGDITPTPPPATYGNRAIRTTTLDLSGAVHHVTVDTATPYIEGTYVTLSNATLSITQGPNGPPAGKITLLWCGYPPTGTYSGLPEGAPVTIGANAYRITYFDGGHNVALLPVSAAGSSTWTGNVSSYWSEPANWSPSGVPANGADLVFPQGARLNTINDVLTSVGKLTINDAYTINGNALQIAGGTERSGPYNTAQINMNLTLTTSQTFGSAQLWPLVFNGSVNVNGKTLTLGNCTFHGPLTGSGTIKGGWLELDAANNTFTGPLNDAALTLSGSAPGVNLVNNWPFYQTGLTANGEATVGDAAVARALRVNDSSGNAGIGLLHTGSLKIDGAGMLNDGAPEYAHDYVDINGTSSDRVDVHGTVILGWAELDVNVLSPAPAGQVYTILSNDGTDPVSGVFITTDTSGYKALPEGTVFQPSSGSTFRISYKGGDGNDVTLTAVGKSATTTHAAASPDVTPVPGTVHVTVTVVPAATSAGAPDGTVSISERGVPAGNATLQNGAATINLNITSPGQHAFAVAYSGSDLFEASSASFNVTGASLKLDAADATTAEGDFGTHTIEVPLTLSATRSSDVTVTYHTEDRTTTAGEDYLGTSGTLTIPAGARSASIPVTIIGDVKPELDEQFWIVFDHASDGTLGKPRVAVTISNDDAAYTRASAIVYASPDATPLTLDVLTPVGATRPLPVVVAFVDAPDEATVARETLRGYVVVVPKTRATFPAKIFDAKAALRWVRANGGQQYSIDPTRIAAWGIGSGGHVAALLGTSADVAALEDGSEGTGESCRVSAVVDFFGETDFVALAQTPGACTVDYTPFFGCSPMTCLDTAQAANPARYATRDDAPFFIAHGTDDCAVPLSQSLLLDEALKGASVPVELHTIEAAAHGGAAFTDESLLRQVDAFLDGILKAGPPRRRAAGR